MEKKFIVANWKNHPDNLAEAEQILDFINEYLGQRNEKELSLVFCPPFVFLEEVGKILQISSLGNKAELGAQDISTDDFSAMTGEVSGLMLKKLGVKYVIVGHSERRWKLGESNETVNKKLKAVLRNDMMPVVCVGERTRDENYKEFLKEQVAATFAGLSADDIGKCFIAYEPVWAISTNPDARPDTPESAVESIKIIKEILIRNWKLEIACLPARQGNLPPFLYGGSVNSANVRSFLAENEIDGVLVGGASINKEEFLKILSIVQKLI